MKEKLVFLKRGEIRTMAKDLAKLQEEAAIKERQRIGGLMMEERIRKEADKNGIVPKPPGSKEAIDEIPLPPTMTKSPAWKKVVIRLVVALLFFAFIFLIGFGCWFFIVKKRQLQPSPSASPLAEASPLESVNPEIPPSPLIPIKEFKIIDIAKDDNLQEKLSQSLNTVSIPESGSEFFELLPKGNDRFFNFKDLSDRLGLKAPADLLSLVSDKNSDFDLLLYTKGAANLGIGFIVKTNNKETTIHALKDWEKTMAADLVPLLKIVGKQGTSLNSLFKQASYGNAFFRYLSFKEKNLGICWSVYENFLVVTSSGESIIKAIDALKTIPD
jgi:hypothetical protein